MILIYYIIYPLAVLIGWMPYKVQFLISDIIRFVLHKVVRYRLNVVRYNLCNAFPEKSQEELSNIENCFYKHLADVFLETMSMASASKNAIKCRMEFTNYLDIERLANGRPWLSAMAHYGSWEYTINYGLLTGYDTVLAVYRPLANPAFEKYYSKTRARFGVTPTPMNDVFKEIVRRRNRGEKVVAALIADQTPPRNESRQWFTFLNQNTQFFMGMEKMALKMRIPVAFLHVEKIKRGYYKARFEIIYDGNEKVSEYEITRRYATKLEEMIRQRPELWMWSHRRWKHKKEN